MIIKKLPEGIAPYLKDASNYSKGLAEAVVIPENSEELASYLLKETRPVAISGAGTGLTAGRIPSKGIIISLEKLDHLELKENGTVKAGPAVTLNTLQKFLVPTGWFYPPNPTETWASLGGNLATNASGSRSYKFGVTRDFVEEIELMLIDGRRTTLKRGLKTTEPIYFSDDSKITLPEIIYESPNCKNAAGYFIKPKMDWLDLFIGSEGTLAIITNIVLRLIPAPKNFVSGILFFKHETLCWGLIPEIKKFKNNDINPCSLEYFDYNALKLLKTKYKNIPNDSKAALFFEQDISDSSEYDSILECWYEFLKERDVQLNNSWFSQGPEDVILFHDFRHALPSIINEANSRAGRVKLGTDMAVPDQYFIDMMKYYQNTLRGCDINHVMFGHLGDNHLHINFLPDANKLEQAKSICENIANQILEWNGTVSAEHGIGKLKKNYLAKMVGPDGLSDFRKIKFCFDPYSRLSTGNIF